MPIQVEIIDNGINSELLVAIITAVSVLLTSVITQVVTYFLQVRKEDKANKREAYSLHGYEYQNHERRKRTRYP